MRSRPRFASSTRLVSWLGPLSFSLAVGCAEGSGGVTRMADGVRYEGRFVNPEAYAAYLLGVEREAHADFPGALAAYAEAHAEDPDSPEIWARIGAVRCVASEPARALSAARSAFERGLKNDPEYFGNYLERARCSERTHEFGAGLSDALAAVARRPEDESANLLVARLLQALGRPTQARDWLEAFQSYRQPSVALLRALDTARRPNAAAPNAAAPAPDTAAPNAETASMAAHSGAFAEIRAGHAERARQRAEIELGADPTNSDAWVATLVACDALRDDVCFETALNRLKVPSLSPSNAALGYLRELLARRAGATVSF